MTCTMGAFLCMMTVVIHMYGGPLHMHRMHIYGRPLAIYLYTVVMQTRTSP